MPLSLDLPEGTSDKIPGIAYTVPDLDANVRIVIKTFWQVQRKRPQIHGSSGHGAHTHASNRTRIKGVLADLDANVRIVIKTLETNEKIACVEASLSNGKTVR
jgi:hypothetical protein